ncbi:hypothetical protein, partial [Streptomyces sp. P17]|uniref:hypothetical protein n=1 Tax=Streptomyces sp. P17 TaxID=3074716 RepID=UPI0028F44A7E
GIIQLGYLETEIIYEVFKNGTVSLSQNSSSYDYSNYTTELNIDVPFIIEDSRFDNLDTETTHSLYYTIRASYL